MGYSYSFSSDTGLGILTGLLSGIPSLVLGIAGYVLMALALYTLAKRRCIHYAWLSWIPVANVWILGSLSDQYRYVVRGQTKSKRKVLLTLGIVMTVLCAVVVAWACVILVGAFGGLMYGANAARLLERYAGPILGVAGLCLPMVGVSIAYTIIYFMALYDVFTSMDPDNNVLFLVMSIVFHVTEPFFLFFNRNQDKGMPPRRPDPDIPPREPCQDGNKDYL